MNGFKAQQARWAKGLMQTAKKILPRVFASDAPWHVKAEAFFHLTANISYPLMVLLSTMLLPAMIVRFYQGWLQMIVIDLPLFLASTCSISSFYLVAQKELRPKTWWRTFLYMPFVMAIGNWDFGAQCASRDRSDHREEKRVRADAEIQDRRKEEIRSSRRNTGTSRAGCRTRKWCWASISR